jgi:hypothetical protein
LFPKEQILGSDGGGRPEPEPQKHQSIEENTENGLNEVLK